VNRSITMAAFSSAALHGVLQNNGLECWLMPLVMNAPNTT